MDFLKFLEEIRTPAGDIFFSVCTFLGSQAAIIILFSVNYWCVDKGFAREIGASFFVSSLFVHNLKITFRIPRPFVRDTSFKPVEAAVSGATGYSFPSGHTQTSASVFIPAAYEYRKRKWVSILCTVLILLTALSRMYLGVHTPADVTAGFLISAVCSGAIIFTRRRFHEKWVYCISAILLAGSVFTVAYAAALNGSGAIEYAYLADSVKTAGACIAYAVGTVLEQRLVGFAPVHESLKKSAAVTAAGLAGAAVFLYGMKLFYSGILLLDGVRYFLAIFWIVFIYPFILTIKKNSETK